MRLSNKLKNADCAFAMEDNFPGRDVREVNIRYKKPTAAFAPRAPKSVASLFVR